MIDVPRIAVEVLGWANTISEKCSEPIRLPPRLPLIATGLKSKRQRPVFAPATLKAIDNSQFGPTGLPAILAVVAGVKRERG